MKDAQPANPVQPFGNPSGQHWGRYYARWVTAAVLLSLCCGEIRSEDLVCEEAVAYLEGCCGNGTISGVSCRYEEGNCGEDDSSPSIDEQQAGCIEGKDCSEIVAAGICDAQRVSDAIREACPQ